MINIIDHPNTSVTDVSRETLDRAVTVFDVHGNIFYKLIDKWMWWNKSVNLFSKKATADQLRQHIIHSLLLKEQCESSFFKKVIDAGSGGGLPGIPLCITDPNREYLMVDKVRKKHFALKDIIRSLKLDNAESIHEDISNVSSVDPVRIVTKHAFHLSDLLPAIQNCNWVELSLLKGEDLFEEVTPDMLSSHTFDICRLNFSGDPFFLNKYIVNIRKL